MNLDRSLRRAKQVEDAIRERAFLPLGEKINGIEVLQFSLRHCTICFHIRSPFFFGGPANVEHVGMFLWIVSPDYDPANTDLRAVFMAMVGAQPNWSMFYPRIRKYLKRAFMDMPPVAEDGKAIAASYAASMVHKIAAAYKWAPDVIMGMPIAALFQLMKWIEVEKKFSTPQFNPLRDAAMARMMERLDTPVNGNGAEHG